MNTADIALADTARQIYIDGYLLCAQHAEDWLRKDGHIDPTELVAFLRANATKVMAGFAISKAKGSAS